MYPVYDNTPTVGGTRKKVRRQTIGGFLVVLGLGGGLLFVWFGLNKILLPQACLHHLTETAHGALHQNPGAGFLQMSNLTQS